MDPFNPLNPLSPISPLNPASPVYFGRTIGDDVPTCTTDACINVSNCFIYGVSAFCVIMIAILIYILIKEW